MSTYVPNELFSIVLGIRRGATFLRMCEFAPADYDKARERLANLREKNPVSTFELAWQCSETSPFGRPYREIQRQARLYPRAGVARAYADLRANLGALA